MARGRVRLDWTIEPAEGPDRRLAIRWRESGGPATRAPEGADYRRELIETILREQIGASGAMNFAEDGVRADISLPLAGGQVILPPGAAGE